MKKMSKAKKTRKSNQNIENYYEGEAGQEDTDLFEGDCAAADETEAEYYEAEEDRDADDGYSEIGEDLETEYYEAEEDAGAEVEYYEIQEDIEAEEGYYEAGEDIEAEEGYYEAGEDIEAEEGYYEAGEDIEAEEGYYEAGEDIEAEEGIDVEDEYYEAQEDPTDESEYYEAEAGMEGDTGYDGIVENMEGNEEYYVSENDLAEDGEGYYGEGELDYNEEITYEEEAWKLKETAPVRRMSGWGGDTGGFFAKFGRFLRSMDIMDRVMLITGVGILILALVMGGVFISAHVTKQQVSNFVNVGKQLEGIGLIGEYGLMAVADAEIARLTAAAIVADEEQRTEYQESGYETQVSVEMNFTSIQKDLKIKFLNKRTGKLVPNVPFAVTVVAPDGSTAIWSDDDMDGIIYKSDIIPGTYKIAMEELTDSRYSDYIISTETQSVTVAEEIVYKKVDVENEVKQESEVNASQEDTKIKDTTVESALQDTVTWVESSVVPSVYDEVLKGNGENDIQDPALTALSLQALNKSFWRMTESSEQAETTDISEETDASSEEPSESSAEQEPTEAPTPEPTEAPTSEPTEAPTPEPTEAPTPEPTEEPTPEPTQEPTPSPSPTPLTVTVAVDKVALTGEIGSTLTAKATVNIETGYQYEITSKNEQVASATIDALGNISVKGVGIGETELTVSVKPTEGSGITMNVEPFTVSVTITGLKALTLDKNSITVLTALTDQDVSGSIVATVTNAGVDSPEVTAVSSDTNVATVNYTGNVVNIIGIKAGSAVITVTYKEGDTTVTATCTVTVKTHPRNDTSTKLQTRDGQQVYVQDGNDYREAVWADYYVEGRTYYVRKEVKYTGWQTLDGKVYFYTTEGVRVTGEQVIQGAKYTFASDGSLLVGSNGTVGIDVSKWNGTIDWNAVKNSGISYVIIRCGYRGSAAGKLIEDPKFEANIKGATAAGLKVGIYFFSQAVNEVEAVEEASMVLGLIKGYTISYPVFLDVEASGGRGDKIDKSTRTAVCNAFCQTIKNEGYTAGVYSNKTWLETKIDAGSLSAYKIWLAQYAEAPTYTGRYEIWQYRDSGKVSGISGNVDMNISYLGY